MINVFDLIPGTSLQLGDGRQVTVHENMDDGMWVSVLESGTAPSEDAELIHAQDIVRVVD